MQILRQLPVPEAVPLRARPGPRQAHNCEGLRTLPRSPEFRQREGRPGRGSQPVQFEGGEMEGHEVHAVPRLHRRQDEGHVRADTG